MLQLDPTSGSPQQLATAGQLTNSDASSKQGVVKAGVDAPVTGGVREQRHGRAQLLFAAAIRHECVHKLEKPCPPKGSKSLEAD